MESGCRLGHRDTGNDRREEGKDRQIWRGEAKRDRGRRQSRQKTEAEVWISDLDRPRTDPLKQRERESPDCTTLGPLLGS